MESPNDNTGVARTGKQPETLPGFAHINRYWDPINSVYAAKLLPGQYYVSCAGEMITTVLGSCVSACIRDRIFRIGGMNHFMLPDYVEGASGAWEDTAVNAATRYGNFAMEHLINTVLKHGGRRQNLEVKLFGGGRVLDVNMDIGRRNAEFAVRYLQTENLVVVASDVGGPYPRKVNYYPASGKVYMKRLRAQHNSTIVDRERNYKHSIEHQSLETEIDLF